MRIFKPKFKNAVGELVESPNWHFEFEFAGQRVSESARTASKELAEKAMRKRHRELEEARALGAPLTREDQRDRVRRVSDFVAAYLVRFEQDHASRPNSITYERTRLKTIVRHLGTRIRGQLTDAVMRGYVTRRVDAGVSGSTINGELAALFEGPLSVSGEGQAGLTELEHRLRHDAPRQAVVEEVAAEELAVVRGQDAGKQLMEVAA